ncbi:MAG: outer rane efflux protein [Fibrobacteres bacterium]|nr:outer rane efflux protein [Fibrobacterota bacterium]
MIHALFLPIAAALALQAGSDTVRVGLRQAMDLGRAAGYQAALARSRAAEAEGRLGEARGALLPRVGATAWDAVRSIDLPAMGLSFPASGDAPAFPNKIGPFNAQDARVNGRVSLIDAAGWNRYRAAGRAVELGRLEAEAVEENSALSAAEAYLALARARALLDSRRSELALASQLAELSLAQKQAGSAAQIEVLRAQGQVSAARSALTAASGGEERARYAFLRIIGKDLDAVPVLSDPLPIAAGMPPGSAEAAGAPAETPGDSLSALPPLPEIAAAEKRKQAALLEMRSLRSELIPTLDLAGDYGLSGRRLNARAEWTENIMLQLNWTIWEGGRRRARLSQQAERLRQADLGIREARLAARQDLRESASAMRTLREESAFSLERVRLSEEEERLSREKFRSGAAGNLEVISAQASVSLAHQAYIDAIYGYGRARLEYLKAAHRLSEI